jgi:hypothetical protein
LLIFFDLVFPVFPIQIHIDFFVQSAPFYSSRSVWSLRLDVVGLCQLLARLYYYFRFALNYFRFPGGGRDLGRRLRRGCFARAAGWDRMRVTRIISFCFCLGCFSSQHQSNFFSLLWISNLSHAFVLVVIPRRKTSSFMR